MRNLITEKYLTQHSRFRTKYAKYNGIDGYFNDDTELVFTGFHYKFYYKNGTLTIAERKQDNSFSIAKVMYVPAERCILGSFDHPTELKNLKNLNEPISDFLDEYGDAKKENKTGYVMPFGGMGFEYDMLNDIPKLKNDTLDIKLSTASSGYQSSLPLLLVSKYLSDMVNSLSNSKLTDKEKKDLQKEVEKIVKDDSLTEDVKMALLRNVSSRYRYSHFINIVEEMELNLFPSSQKSVLYELIKDANKLDANKLVLTTHSPYVINYLTLAIKAWQLKNREGITEELLADIHRIVPEGCDVRDADVAIYQLHDGMVESLSDYEGLPSDDNFLNIGLESTNASFDALLEIEESMN